MRIVFCKSKYVFVIVTLFGVMNMGCVLSTVEQRQKTVTDGKAQESIFTVVDTTDLENPTLAASIRLPFHSGPNSNVVLLGRHAYLTTKKHLHVINISNPQQPHYLTSLEFVDDIGKAVLVGHQVVVASPQKLYFIDISNPAQPVLQSTTHLPQRNPIKDMDVRDLHLYVLGENNALYIFFVDFEEVRLVRTVKLHKHWRLVSPETEATKVEQILHSESLLEPLLYQKGFLQFHSGKQQKVRASSEFLGVGYMRNTTCDLKVFDAARIPRGGGAASYTSTSVYFNLEQDFRTHLNMTGKMTLTHEKPTIAYSVVSGKMQQIAPDQLSETIEVNDKPLVCPITDFQISGDLLYIVSEKGLFSIVRVVKIEDFLQGERGKFISATLLQPSRPISIAVEENYVCVLAAIND